MWVRRNFLRGRVVNVPVLPGWGAGILFAAVGQTTAPNSDGQVMSHLNLVLRWSRQWESADIFLVAPAMNCMSKMDGNHATSGETGISRGTGTGRIDWELISRPLRPPPGNADNAINAQNLFNRQQRLLSKPKCYKLSGRCEPKYSDGETDRTR